MNEQAQFHAIERTSPKGTPFIGTCSLCGKTGLRIADISEPCENVRGLSQDDALIEALDPDRLREDRDERQRLAKMFGGEHD